jgi:hypothetical protein
MKKPAFVPFDIWVACNETQRKWCIKESEKQKQEERIKRKIDAYRNRVEVKPGEGMQ